MLALCGTNKILFSIAILAENTFLIEIKSPNNLKSFINQFNNKEIPIDFLYFYPKILNIISERLELDVNSKEDNQTELILRFSINQEIIKHPKEYVMQLRVN